MRNWDWRLNFYFRILPSLRSKVRIPTQVRLKALFSSFSTFTLKYDQGQPDLNSGKHKGSRRSQRLYTAVTRCHGWGHPETTEMYTSHLWRVGMPRSKQWHSQDLKRSLFCFKDVKVLEFGIQTAEREKLWTQWTAIPIYLARCAQRHSSGMMVMGVTKHFLLVFEFWSIRIWHYRPSQRPITGEVIGPGRRDLWMQCQTIL